MKFFLSCAEELWVFSTFLEFGEIRTRELPSIPLLRVRFEIHGWAFLLPLRQNLLELLYFFQLLSSHPVYVADFRELLRPAVNGLR